MPIGPFTFVILLKTCGSESPSGWNGRIIAKIVLKFYFSTVNYFLAFVPFYLDDGNKTIRQFAARPAVHTVRHVGGNSAKARAHPHHRERTPRHETPMRRTARVVRLSIIHPRE